MTDLSDGELALLDVLLLYRANFYCLRDERFVARFMHSSHGYDDAKLQKVLSSLCQRKVLKFDRQLNAFSMTELGCDLWSSERCPVWPKFAAERYGEHRSGKETVSIVATATDTLDEILTTGRELGMWQLDRAKVRRTRIRNHKLIAGRQFPILHVAVAVITPCAECEDFLYEDVSECERRRTWWRNVRELQRLLPTSGG
jgi:hypothetical protein